MKRFFTENLRLKTFALLLFCAIALFLPLSSHAATNVSGLISSNTTWTLANSPYIVTGSVLVNSGVTLTIEPGVIVKFDSLKALQIDGTLIARGNSSSKITFTSNQATPASGDWGYILFSDSSIDATYDVNGNYTGGSILEYAVVEYAGGVSVSDNGAVRMNNAHPFINYCTIRKNKASGIYGWNLTGTLKVTNSTISNNTASYGGGIYVSGGTVTISNNSIFSNTASAHYIGSYFASGAGIYVGDGTVNISNNVISDNINIGQSGSGGGINVNNGTVTISNNIIRNNTAEYGGGGIHIRWGSTNIWNNTITHNSAGSMWGGGGILLSTGESVVTISQNIISNNTASGTDGGGGIYFWGNQKSIVSNAILQNFALNASAVWFGYVGDNMDFKYNTITGNQTTGTSPTYTVYVSGHPLFNYNNIFANATTYELYNNNAQGTANVDAKNNWWGTSVESEIQAKIYDWFDDATKGIVDYSPYEAAMRTDAPVSPPTGVTATAGAGSISLTWSANPEGDTTGYKVYYDTDSGYPYANVVDVGNVTSHTITGLPVGTYYVTVTAYDTSYNLANDDPNTIVNENQTNGNESWYAVEAGQFLSPDISVNPVSVDFGSVNVSTTSTQQVVTFTNAGTADLHVSGGELLGANAAMFAVTGVGATPCNPPFTAPPSSSCTLGFTFTPSSAGAKTATFRVYSDDPDSPNFDVPLSGTGVGQPNISSSVSSLNFGSVNVGTTTTAQTVTFTNTGTADLNVTGGSLTGTDASMFAIIGGTCPIPPFTSTPSESCNLSFTFTPASAGLKTATFTVYSDAVNDPDIDIPLSGTGAPQYTLNVNNNPSSGGMVTGTDISCPEDCTGTYNTDTALTLTATANNGYTFGSWTGCDSVSGDTCDITMNSEKTITPTFISSAQYVVWSDNTYGNNEIFLKKSTDGGNTWTFQRLTNNIGNSAMPTVAASGNDVYVVWQDDTYGPSGVPEIFLKKSTDGGNTWAFQRLTTNTGNSQVPAIAVNGNEVYVVWQDDTYGNNEIFFRKSTDGGNAWMFQRLTNNTGNSQVPAIAVNGNEVYVVWQDDTYGPSGVPEIFMKRSADSGATWQFQRLTTNAGYSGRPSMVVDGGNIYVVWPDDTYGPTGVPEIFMKKSIDGGNTWAFQRITTNTGYSGRPSIALSSGNLYLVWEDNTYGNNEIFLKKSIDGGNAWTFQRLTNNIGVSMNPSIRVNGTDVYTVWQDDTYGPTGVPEIFMKRSADSGATWQFQRLTTNTGNSVMPAMPR